MARTLGTEDANQVTHPGRRVLIGWTGPPPNGLLAGSQGSAQSLPRELSLNRDKVLLQRFVPELEALRLAHSHLAGPATERPSPFGLAPVEVLAFFLYWS